MSEVSASLEKAVEEFKNLSSVKEEEKVKPVLSDPKSVLAQCRSIKDIEEQFSCFSYDDESKVMKCRLCGQDFEYGNEETDFEEQTMSVKFSNTKHSLLRHLNRTTHKAAEAKEAVSQKQKEKVDHREQAIGLRAGSLCFYLSSKGVADLHYPELVHLLASMGLDMGSLNHSTWFPPKFLQAQAKVIRDRVDNFLSTRLVATGNLPPTQLLCDKATFRHWGRLFAGVATIVPGATELLQALYLGSPRCAGSSGEAQKDCIVGIVGERLKAEQIMGTSGDGHTAHCHVWEKVKAHYKIKGGFQTKDPMHNAATVDTNMRNEKTGPVGLKYQNDMTRDIGAANNFINLGEGFHLFCKVC